MTQVIQNIHVSLLSTLWCEIDMSFTLSDSESLYKCQNHVTCIPHLQLPNDTAGVVNRW